MLENSIGLLIISKSALSTSEIKVATHIVEIEHIADNIGDKVR